MSTVGGVLALLLRALWRRIPRRTHQAKPVPAWRAPGEPDTRTSAMRRTQYALGAAGLLIAGWGAVALLTTVSFSIPHYGGLILWLGGTVVVHDAILVPTVTALRAALLRVGRTLPHGGLFLIQGGFVVGAALSLISIPEIYAKSLGTANPTVLPSAYAMNLVWTWIVLSLIVTIGTAVLALRSAASGRSDTGVKDSS